MDYKIYRTAFKTYHFRMNFLKRISPESCLHIRIIQPHSHNKSNRILEHYAHISTAWENWTIKYIYSFLVCLFDVSFSESIENMVATLWLLSLLTVTLITVSECVYAPPPLVKYRRFDSPAFGIQVNFFFYPIIHQKYSNWEIFVAKKAIFQLKK